MSKKPTPKKPVQKMPGKSAAKKTPARKPAALATPESTPEPMPAATPAPQPQAAPPVVAAATPAQPAKPAEGYVVLGPGDPAPWFSQRSTSNPKYVFDTAAGRWLVLCFFGSAGDPASRAVLDQVLAHRDLFDDEQASFSA